MFCPRPWCRLLISCKLWLECDEPGAAMSALVLAQVTIKDREAYAAYEAGFLAILNDHQGQIVSVDESPDVLEGDWPCTRTVVLKFESKAMAQAWYTSTDYQTLAQIRFNSASANVVIIDGLA